MAKRSKRGKLNWRDIGHGLVVALFSGVIGGAEQLLTNGGDFTAINSKSILNWGLVAGIGYIAKQFGTNSKGELKPEAPKPDTDNP